MADSNNLPHCSRKQLSDLLVVQPCRGDDKCANTRVQNRIDLELIPTDVLVLREKNPLTLADDREELDITLTREFVERSCIMAL